MNPKTRLLAVCVALIALGGLTYYALTGPSLDTPPAGAGGARALGGGGAGGVDGGGGPGETYTVDVTDYRPESGPLDALLTDDEPGSKEPAFDPALVHRSPVDGWSVNLSAAVVRLDVPMIRPDADADLLTLHPTYRAAVESGKRGPGGPRAVLPSVNLVDGLAKQFDDGLYAALDEAYYEGLEGTLESHVRLVRRLLDAVGPESPAAPFLAAGLELAGESAAVADERTKRQLLASFEGDPLRSKPIGFYTWSPTLERCFRFLKFFQKTFPRDDPTVPDAIAAALAGDEAIRDDYRAAVRFYARLTNPLRYGTMLDLVEGEATAPQAAGEVALFPSSSSREGELFLKLFPIGLPPDTDLMKEFIRRIRSGEVDLAPRPESGWYDYQVHALEALLLPEKGRESEKLLLTTAYKKRMLEAFRALMTKRRETHVRQLDFPAPMAAAIRREELRIEPRLRVEPSLTYYLRTARAYAFLQGFLLEAIGAEALGRLHGLRKDGPREKDLATELRDIRDLFYGLYLLGCEDIGLKPEFLEGEQVDRDRAEAVAGEWLDDPLSRDDLDADTRVAVPIYRDPVRNVTRLWVTLGVRLARLDASFDRGPSVRRDEGDGEWEACQPSQLRSKTYLIAVDEFAEVEVPGGRVLTREEWRAICDRHGTKEAILQALRER